MTRPGFTLTEVLIVVGIAAILVSISAVSLLSIQTKASLHSLSDQLLADIKSQQLKSMTGETEGSDTVSSYGICFQDHSYILFRGSAYSSSDPANFSIPIEAPISLSSAFPLSGSCPSLIFTPGSGEIANFTAGADSVTFSGEIPSEFKILQFNRYGVLISS